MGWFCSATFCLFVFVRVLYLTIVTLLRSTFISNDATFTIVFGLFSTTTLLHSVMFNPPHVLL
jgi:hypothetical protein